MSTFLYPPVSITTLPPVGGATSANQVLEIAELQNINTELDAQSVYLSVMTTDIGEINAKTPMLVGGKVPVISQDQVQTATFVEDQTVSTTPETFVAPAGAFAALIETDENNSVNLRVVMGGVSSPTSGIQYQPGRSEMYQGGSDISYCAESSSGQKISVQWFIKT